jgi:hypothetical protein
MAALSREGVHIDTFPIERLAPADRARLEGEPIGSRLLVFVENDVPTCAVLTPRAALS